MDSPKRIGIFVGVVGVGPQTSPRQLIDGVLLEHPDTTEHGLREPSNGATLIGVEVLEWIGIRFKTLVVAHAVCPEHGGPANAGGEVVIFPGTSPDEAVVVYREVPRRRDEFVVACIL